MHMTPAETRSPTALPPLVVFSHGKESGPWGTKIRYLADIAQAVGARIESIDYSDLMDPDQRVQRLLAYELPPHSQLILVGSSMGGYVSTVASATLKPAGLFLLAPAFYLPGYAVISPRPNANRTSLVFGWRDEIIPVENAIRFAREHRANLYLIDGDHRLNDQLTDIGPIFRQFLSTVLPAKQEEMN